MTHLRHDRPRASPQDECPAIRVVMSGLIVCPILEELAMHLGVNPWTVGRWETEHTKPPLRVHPEALHRYLSYRQAASAGIDRVYSN